MKKHAYLIMAHNNFYILEKLLLLLDDYRNDIFIHIDKKIVNFDFLYFKKVCSKSNVYFTKKRINVIWSHQSQVLTEMLLFKTAFETDKYEWFHLISGVDMPLKTQDEIHSFFDNHENSILELAQTTTDIDKKRISIYHNVFGRSGKTSKFLNNIIDIIQHKFNINRVKNMTVIKGANWCNLKLETVEILLHNEHKIRKMTRFSVCADEVYKQTILLNLNLEKYDNDYKRLIDFDTYKNGHPYIYTSKDFDKLINSDAFFARKFDENTDLEIVDMIYNYLKKD